MGIIDKGVTSGVVSSFMQEALSIATDTPFSFYEFATSKGYLNKKPHPVQTVILKLIDGIPLDNKVKNVEIMSEHSELLWSFTEEEFLHFAYEEGRCNWSSQQDARNRVLMMIGRRGGKSWLDGILESGALFKFLNLGNPYEFFHLDETTEIRIGSISASEDQATIIYNAVSDHIVSTPLFKPFKHKVREMSIDFWHPCVVDRLKDLTEDDKKKRSIKVLPLASSSKTSRGFSYYMLILDEFGHFPHVAGPNSAKETLKALRPAVGTFGKHGMLVISTSTPPMKSYGHKFYEKEMKSGSDSEYFICRFPTWWTNPNPHIMYDISQAYKADKAAAEAEYGAEFGHKGETWVPQSILESINVKTVSQRSPYFFTGIDIAFGRDGADIVTVNPTTSSKIEVVDHRHMVSGENQFQGLDCVPPEVVASELNTVNNIYKPRMILADQFEAFSFMALLDMSTVKVLRDISFTGRLNTVLYEVFGDFLINQHLYTNSEYIIESLKGLKAYRPQEDKLVVTARSGSRDDASDAFARAVLAMILFMRKYPAIAAHMPFSLNNLNVVQARQDEIDSRLVFEGDDYQKSKASRYLNSVQSLQIRNSDPASVAARVRSSFSTAVGRGSRGNVTVNANRRR